MLRDRGIVSQKTLPISVDEGEALKSTFKQYLSQERGLSVSILHITLVSRISSFGSDLAVVPVSSRRCVPQMSRDSFDVTFTSAARAVRQHIVGSLRAFLRYLRYRGEITTTWPPVYRRWRTGRFRRYPGSYSRDKYSKCSITAIGAVPWVCATMRSCCCWRGSVLRACEVVAMTLDDIDWEGGSSDGARQGRAVGSNAVAAEVGRAIVAYLQERTTALCESTSIYS